jgi:ethanolamine utilization protein EutN
MYLGKVIGRVWSTAKNQELDGQRLLVVQPITPEGKPSGRTLICTDSTGAGAGETIFWVRGREASFALPGEVPADTSIVGIVDDIHVKRGG